jgi:hypothetical protein
MPEECEAPEWAEAVESILPSGRGFQAPNSPAASSSRMASVCRPNTRGLREPDREAQQLIAPDPLRGPVNFVR